MQLQHGGRRHIIAQQVGWASTWFERAVGLLTRKAIGSEEALIIPSCRSIHTCGMRFPIDVVFVDRHWRVVAVRAGVPPWRIVGPVRRAWAVVEMQAGRASATGIMPGERLEVIGMQENS